MQYDKINTIFKKCIYLEEDMPKVAYNEEEKVRVREKLLSSALELMSKQGIRRTTVEQIYRSAGISRTFFYSFFPTKEDLVVEMFYLQQPRIISYAKSLMEDRSLTWKEGVERFLHDCCYGEKNGIAVMTIDEQQQLFRRLSKQSYEIFRQRQRELFGRLLECFGIVPERRRVELFINVSLSVMVLRKSVPEMMPMLVPEALDETVDFQIKAIVSGLEKMRE